MQLLLRCNAGIHQRASKLYAHSTSPPSLLACSTSPQSREQRPWAGKPWEPSQLTRSRHQDRARSLPPACCTSWRRLRAPPAFGGMVQVTGLWTTPRLAGEQQDEAAKGPADSHNQAGEVAPPSRLGPSPRPAAPRTPLPPPARPSGLASRSPARAPGGAAAAARTAHSRAAAPRQRTPRRPAAAIALSAQARPTVAGRDREEERQRGGGTPAPCRAPGAELSVRGVN